MNHQLYNILTTDAQVLFEYPELAIGLLNNTLVIKYTRENNYIVVRNSSGFPGVYIEFDVVFRRTSFWYREVILSPNVGFFTPPPFPTIITIRI